MTADERLELIQAKIKRANKHIVDLNAAISVFMNSKPYKIGTKRDPDTRKLIYYIASVFPTPTPFAVITGDAIQNLRSALDHLAQQLFFVGSGTNTMARHVQFLVEQNAAQYEGRLPRVVQGMRQDAIDALSALEPYKGGKGHEFWVLHELNNVDKHRLLVTVGSSFRSLDIGSHLVAQLPEQFRDFALNLFLKPADTLCPLKEGDELFIDAPDAEPNEKMQFRFDIALSEPGIIESKPLLEALQHFSDLVSNTVGLFKPCLS